MKKMTPVTILAIETSCDETSVAVLRDGTLLSNIVSSQLVHDTYGGVVPELASRAHQKLMIPIVNEALGKAGISPADITAIGGVYGPGLMGSLLVGLNFGKAYAYALNVPFVGVNHMEAHIYSNFITTPSPEFPFLCLTVSGGHTQLVLVRRDFDFEIIGETRDDAAGEAFDKVAKMLGLGYPGGPRVDKLAKSGNPAAIRFPRSFLPGDRFGFSFSGIKTSVLYYLRDHRLLNTQIADSLLADICASFQAAVVDVLTEKTLDAAAFLGVQDIAVAGGVSANSGLRTTLTSRAAKRNCRVFVPPFEYCTDNGAMIALTAYRKYLAGYRSALSQTAIPYLSLGEVIEGAAHG
ncbi:MAG: tRNA (adenosine(37)-N6)-threonylcarbamoyltransferase complex transferase subunit TsaD [Ignavibacteriales bacterium]|nr:tRNA (adenosine(37)-N6)-threonylcarbamoyltransferase complex transferase subunit TsaD [Ignavibacteriales bacterium]